MSLNLANVNMASGQDSSSIIHTVSSEDESLAAAGKEGLANLQQFGEEQKAKEVAARKQADEAAATRKAEFIRIHFTELVKASQARAVRNHPDLSAVGSAFNQKFVNAYKDLQSKKDSTLENPNWPEILAGDTPPLDIPEPVIPTPPRLSDHEPTPAPLITWRTPPPPYPTQARMSHVTGTTTVRVTTDASGSVSSVVIVKSAGSAILDSSTEGYVKMNWKGPPNSTHDTTFEYRLQ